MKGSVFVSKVDAALKEMGANRVTLAEYCGTSVQVFSDWKRRNNLPKIDIAIKISRFLGVALEWLFEDDYEQQWEEGGECSGLTDTGFSPKRLMFRLDNLLRSLSPAVSQADSPVFYTDVLAIFTLDQIRAMKNNRYAPSVVQLCKVAARFNLSLEWLIAGHLAEPGRDVALEVYDLAEKHSVSLLLYHKLSSCDRAIVDTLAQSLLAREKGQAQ